MASNVTVVIAPKGAVETGDAIKGVAKKAEESAGPVGKLNDALGGMAKIAGGFVLGQGITSAPEAFMDMARAAAEDEASTKRVETAIHALSGNYEDHIGKVNEAIAVGQKKAFTDDETRDAVTKLALATGDTDEAMKRLAVAQDLARGANIPLADASRLLGKVTDENLQVFKRMGITLPNVASEADVLAAVQAKFAGQADQYANSTAGQFARAEDAISEAKEAIGYKLIPVMATAAEGALKLTDAFDAHVMPAIDKVAGVVGEAADAFQSLPTSTQQVAGGFAAMALAAGPALQGGQKLTGMVKELGEGSLGAGEKLTLLTAGVGALAVGVDVLLNKTTGAGLIDHVFGDVASIEAHANAMGNFSAAVLASGPNANKLAIATDMLATAQRGLTDAGGAAIGKQSELSNVLLGSDNRLFGFNIGLSGGIDKMKGFKEQVAVAADEMVRNGATLGQMREEYDKLDPALQKVFDEHTHIEEALRKVQLANLDAAGASAAHRYAMEQAGTAISTSSEYVDGFTLKIKNAKDPVKELNDALTGLTDTFSKMNPEAETLRATNATLNEELDDLKNKTGDLTATEQARVKVLEDAIAKNDKLIAGYDSNQKAVEGLTPRMKTLLGAEGYGGLLTAMNAVNVPQEQQIDVLGKISSAMDHASSHDIPGMLAGLRGLKEELKAQPGAWEAVMQTLGPKLQQAIKEAGPDAVAAAKGVGQDIIEGVQAGLDYYSKFLFAQAREMARRTVDEMHNGIQAGSPSKLSRDQVGIPIGEGIVVGLKQTASLVRDVAVLTAQEAVDAANAIVKAGIPAAGAGSAASASSAGGAIAGGGILRGTMGMTYDDVLANVVKIEKANAKLGGDWAADWSKGWRGGAVGTFAGPITYSDGTTGIAVAPDVPPIGGVPKYVTAWAGHTNQMPVNGGVTPQITVNLLVDGVVLAQHIEQSRSMAMS